MSKLLQQMDRSTQTMADEQADEQGEEDEEDEWDPQPCELREGETQDVNTHARRNLAQIRQAVESGVLDEADYEEAKERLTEGDNG